MSLILNIETATTCCSAALSEGGAVLASKELDDGYRHAENLHIFIKEVLKNGGRQMKDLSAVAVSRGPGSYTGLRIGSTTAKGIAYALNIPLISVDTLLVMAIMARETNSAPDFYCPMIDARRMEVYSALYSRELQQAEPTAAVILDEETVERYKGKDVLFFGDGMPKSRHLLKSLPKAHFAENIRPSARYMAQAAFKKFENSEFESTAYFEPFYLKEFVAGRKKKMPGK